MMWSYRYEPELNGCFVKNGRVVDLKHERGVPEGIQILSLHVGLFHFFAASHLVVPNFQHIYVLNEKQTQTNTQMQRTNKQHVSRTSTNASARPVEWSMTGSPRASTTRIVTKHGISKVDCTNYILISQKLVSSSFV